MARYLIDNTAAPIDFESNKNGNVERTLQNCKNLIRCKMGEVPYDRRRGLNPAVFDMPIAQLNNVLLSEIDRVLAWEPDAEAVSAKAYRNEKGELIIQCIVDVRE